MPGVEAVLTAADFASLRWPAVNALVTPLHPPAAELMSPDRLDAVGAVVAVVVAATRAQAQAAADAVLIDADELSPVLDFAVVGRDAGSHNGVTQAGHLVAEMRVEHGALPAGAASAQARIALPRVAAMAMEPRAALMRWDATGGRLQAWLSTQTPARARLDAALALGLGPECVDVIAPDVGGAFGGKASVFPEDLLLALATRLLGGALCWQSTRMEDLVSGTHGRASRLLGRLWLDDAGRMSALQAEAQFALGHWLPYSAVVPMRNAARILPGPYRIERLHITAEARLSNAAAVGIYRGAGRPEAAILMERLVDDAARWCGFDPLALRLANVWPAADLPRTLAHGGWLDRCDLPGLLQAAAQGFDYAGRRAEQVRRRAAGEWVGIGIGLYVEPCGQGAESVVLTAKVDGQFELATGATAQGQGRETSFARIAAQALGCAPEAVRVLHGDTRTCPSGVGALASRSTAIGGSAVLQAARELRQRLDAGAALPCRVELQYTAPQEAWSSGCVMAAVRIDGDTGALSVEDITWADDAGHVVDAASVRGQLLGGLAQGLGQALMERVVYDEHGQLLTGSLMDYALPRAADMPPVRLISCPTPSAANALGAKGVGEAGCIGVPAALLNAAHDALSDWPEIQLDFPLTAERLWRAMQSPR